MRNKLTLSVVALILLGCLTGTLWAQDNQEETLQSEFVEAIQSRDLPTVQSILKAHPEWAALRVGPDVPILLVAVFSKDQGRFVRPEDNKLVSMMVPHIQSPGMFEACVTGNLDRAKALIGGNPSLVDSAAASGWTPMHFAAYSGNVELAQYLYDHGADVNARAWKSSYIVPLLSGMLVQRYEISRLLLDLGADPLVRERGGFSAMHEAANFGDTALIRLLYDRGAELNSRRDTGERPIDLAAKYEFTAAVALLKELGAEE